MTAGIHTTVDLGIRKGVVQVNIMGLLEVDVAI